METLPAILAFCEGNPHKGPVLLEAFQLCRALFFRGFFLVYLNKLLNKQSSGWWFEIQKSSCDVTVMNFDPFLKGIHCCEIVKQPISKEPAKWWCHQMEKKSALLILCVGNSPVTGEFPSHRPVTRSFDVSFDLHLNKWLSKQSWGWWFETPLRSLWRHCNGLPTYDLSVTVCGMIVT